MARGKARRLASVVAMTACSAFITIASMTAAQSQECGTTYKIKENETLADIAARTYGQPGLWTVIFYANQERLGSNASLLVPGLEIRLPCIGRGASKAATRPTAEDDAAPAPAPSPNRMVASTLVRRIELLTADGFPPFTGRGLEGGGMISEIIETAMALVKQETGGKLEYKVSWVNDWSAHLDPLLVNRAFDAGFPWIKPNCQDTASLDEDGKFRCSRFFYSDPLHEFVLRLFVGNESPIKTLAEDQLKGTTLCRPAGYSMSDLDASGRNWLKDGKIILLRPAAIDDCFRLLGDGLIDGVVINELGGLASINALGLKAQVRAIEEPLAIKTMHVIVSKTHPYSRTILYYVNEGLQRLRANEKYDAIVERHLQRFWEAQSSQPDSSLGTTPASGAPAKAKDGGGNGAVSQAPGGARDNKKAQR